MISLVSKLHLDTNQHSLHPNKFVQYHQNEHQI